jgi:hypothetical protein
VTPVSETQVEEAAAATGDGRSAIGGRGRRNEVDQRQVVAREGFLEWCALVGRQVGDDRTQAALAPASRRATLSAPGGPRNWLT